MRYSIKLSKNVKSHVQPITEQPRLGKPSMCKFLRRTTKQNDFVDG